MREQFVEDDAQRIDVGRHRHGLSLELLGGRVAGGQCRAALSGQGCLAHPRVRNEVSDAEVEQGGATGLVDQDVRRLQIAMDHEQRMCGAHRLQHLKNELDALAHAEAAPVRPAVDVFAMHELQHHVGLVQVGDSRVEQLRDARPAQAREDRPFASEALLCGGVEEAVAQQLDGRFALEPAIVSTGSPHTAHAAFADQVDQGPGAESVAGGCTDRHQVGSGRPRHEVGGARVVSRTQQGAEFVGCVRVGVRHRVEMPLPLLRIEREQFIHLRAQHGPTGRVDGEHGARRCSRALRHCGAATRSRLPLERVPQRARVDEYTGSVEDAADPESSPSVASPRPRAATPPSPREWFEAPLSRAAPAGPWRIVPPPGDDAGRDHASARSLARDGRTPRSSSRRREELVSYAGRVMRGIVIDHLRHKAAARHGGKVDFVPYDTLADLRTMGRQRGAAPRRQPARPGGGRPAPGRACRVALLRRSHFRRDRRVARHLDAHGAARLGEGSDPVVRRLASLTRTARYELDRGPSPPRCFGG